MAESALVFITAQVGFPELVGTVARVLGYPTPDLPDGALEATLPADSDRPELSLLDSSRGPAEYSLSVWAGDQAAAEKAAAGVFEALAAATPWAVETDPEDGSPARTRPALRTTA